MVTAVPADNRHQVGEGTSQLVQGEPDRVPAVHESGPAPGCGVVMNGGQVAGQAGQFRTARDQVCA